MAVAGAYATSFDGDMLLKVIIVVDSNSAKTAEFRQFPVALNLCMMPTVT